MRTTQALKTTVFIFCYFLFFAKVGLFADFTGDDIGNLHHYWGGSISDLVFGNVVYFSVDLRPMGGIFYRTLFWLFGFNPFPFRIVCYVFLTVNLFLLYCFARRITHSREVAVLATLLGSYHAWFVDLYYSSGTIFELLCFFFYFSAFLYYLRIRQSGKFLTLRQWIVFCLLYILSLNSKEMAVTLPFFVGVYELLYSPTWPRSPRWLLREGLGATVTCLITVPYVLTILLAPGSIIENSLYRPEVSLSRYLHTFHIYLNPLFYADFLFDDFKTVTLWIVLLSIALWKRSPCLQFCWTFIMFSVLPFIFIPHYSSLFLYIPFVGWVIYAASFIVESRDYCFARFQASGTLKETIGHSGKAQILTFLLLAVLLTPAHLAETPRALENFMSIERPPMSQFARQLGQIHSEFPAETRILFVNDPFETDNYFLLLLVQIYYRDTSIVVERQKGLPKASSLNFADYDYVFDYSDGRLIELKSK